MTDREVIELTAKVCPVCGSETAEVTSEQNEDVAVFNLHCTTCGVRRRAYAAKKGVIKLPGIQSDAGVVR